MPLSQFLIADDSEAKMMMLKGMLHHAHWNVEIVEAASTEQAKHLIDAHPGIAFAFVDYYIPSENGPAIIAYLKQINPRARIALVSSVDVEKNVREAKAAGAETCICTTYQSDVVERAILELIENWRGRD